MDCVSVRTSTTFKEFSFCEICGDLVYSFLKKNGFVEDELKVLEKETAKAG
jgi:hypothetical protein